MSHHSTMQPDTSGRVLRRKSYIDQNDSAPSPTERRTICDGLTHRSVVVYDKYDGLLLCLHQSKVRCGWQCNLMGGQTGGRCRINGTPMLTTSSSKEQVNANGLDLSVHRP